MGLWFSSFEEANKLLIYGNKERTSSDTCPDPLDDIEGK